MAEGSNTNDIDTYQLIELIDDYIAEVEDIRQPFLNATKPELKIPKIKIKRENKRYNGASYGSEIERITDGSKNLNGLCDLDIFYTNIDSLKSKIRDLKSIVNYSRPDVIILTETKLKASTDDSKIAISGYTLYRNDRLDGNGGGVAIYVAETINSSPPTITYTGQRCKLIVSPDSKELRGVWELLWIDIKFNSESSILIGAVYISQKIGKHAHERLLENLKNSVREAMNRENFLLMGNFNFPDIKWPLTLAEDCRRSMKSSYESFFRDGGLVQCVAEPTRFRLPQKPSLLDLVFTNGYPLPRVTTAAPVGKNDHVVVNVATKIIPIGAKAHCQRVYYEKLSARFRSERINETVRVEAMWTELGKIISAVERRETEEWNGKMNVKDEAWNRYKNAGLEYYRISGMLETEINRTDHLSQGSHILCNTIRTSLGLKSNDEITETDVETYLSRCDPNALFWLLNIRSRILKECANSLAPMVHKIIVATDKFGDRSINES